MSSDNLVKQAEARFKTTVLRLCGFEGTAGELGSLQSLVGKAPDLHSRLIAASWVRACTASASFPHSSDLDRALSATVEQELLEVYPRIGVDARAQTYEKRKKLTSALAQLERDLGTTATSAIELNVLGTIRQSFMKAFKTPLAQAVVWPFFPKELVAEARLAALFQSATDLVESGADDVMDSYRSACETLGAFYAEADRFGTIYSRKFLGDLARTLQSAVQSYMANSPLAQPANVDVSDVKKKYPLLSVGNTIRLVFQVKNRGPGTAREVLFRVLEIGDANLQVEKSEWYLGTLADTVVEIAVPVVVNAPANDSAVCVAVTWTNFDHKQDEREFVFDVLKQRSDVDWEAQKYRDPFSLEPVESEAELVGRADVLEQLTGLAYSKSVGSCYLFGQKRVGKTSVVKTLQNLVKLRNDISKSTVLYFERGEFVHFDPLFTIETLGKKICLALKASDTRLAHLTPPAFSGALAPITDFLDEAIRIVPDFRALIVLDEFDELPIALYKRTDVGDAFFGSVRSVTNMSAFGFILVGSENMRHVIHLQGHALNKFQTIELDYFDRQKHWADFQELVRRPVHALLDVEDDAIVELYDATAGNPFFAKLICGRLFKTMVNRRDCHVTKIEMSEATQVALRQDMGINKVQHFWSDGIFEAEAKHEEKSLQRRKILLSLAYAARNRLPIRCSDFFEVCIRKFGIDDRMAELELRDLANRKIVREADGMITFVIPMFLRWLIDSGINEIVAASIDADASFRRSREEEDARIRSEEILSVAHTWEGGFKGRQISEDLVRTWLTQFGDNTQQRIAFKILQGLKFYSQSEIRTKVREAHGIVNRHLVQVIEEGRRKRNDILVSYLDGPGKSGSRYAKLYADENGIYADNVVERSQIKARLQEPKEEIRGLVFVDDLIGTGRSAAENFEHLMSEEAFVQARDRVRLFFIAICGLESGRTALNQTLVTLALDVEVHICDPLDDQDRLFSAKSRVFSDQPEREVAAGLCRELGARLEKKHPLGYGDAQLAIIFEDTAPNNSLPILWKKRKGWTALFPRD